MAEIEFNRGDPATDAFRAGQKFNAEQEAREEANRFTAAANPSRLRAITAGADMARTQADTAAMTQPYDVSIRGSESRLRGAAADVATQSVPYDVSARRSAADTAGANARTAGASADVAQGTVTPRIEEAQAGARTAGAGADVAQGTVQSRIRAQDAGTRTAVAGADVAEGTVQPRIDTAVAGARQAKATAVTAELSDFHYQLELLNQGRVQEAQEHARRSGHGEIPQPIIEDADLRASVTAAANAAKTLYPNRPELQLKYIQGAITDAVGRKQQGQPANTPTAPYQVTGAPTPPASSADVHNFEQVSGTKDGVAGVWTFDKRTGERTFNPNESVTGRGAGGHQSVFQLKQQAWLAAHPGDAQGALDYASGRRSMSEAEIVKNALTMAQREANANITLKFDQGKYQEFVQQRAAEIATQLRGSLGAPTPPASPAAPQAGQPAPGRTSRYAQPPGMGTRDQPFMATTQDDIEWFKTSGQPGQVISVNGELFTK